MDLLKAFDKVLWVKSPANILNHWDNSVVRYGFDVVKPENAFSLHQVHGNTVVAAPKDRSFEPQADGIYTQQRGKKIAIKTADCVPILFSAPGFVMGIHAGWRGIAKGIVTEATRTLTNSKIELNNVLVGIGPHISVFRYEVGDDVIDAMKNSAAPDLDYCLIKSGPQKWHIDLGAKCAGELIGLGIQPQNITCSRSCTYTETSVWPSYRRDGANAGRLWSWVELV
ncbi:MAG: polyphenol oxidase family protein [Oligoflexales bacterium]